VLTSGDHGKVSAWRQVMAEQVTKQRRPDLWAAYKGRKSGGDDN